MDQWNAGYVQFTTMFNDVITLHPAHWRAILVSVDPDDDDDDDDDPTIDGIVRTLPPGAVTQGAGVRVEYIAPGQHEEYPLTTAEGVRLAKALGQAGVWRMPGGGGSGGRN